MDEGCAGWPLANGDFVTGPGIPHTTTIASGAGSSTWGLSKAATTSGTETLTASG